MSLFEVYWRALRYLAAERQKVALICAANVALGMVMIAEPVLFGQIIDAIAEKDDLVDSLALWVGLGVFNIIAFVLVARGADRLAHARRVAVLCESFERVISMPLSWHQKRGTSNALHTLLRAVETLFGLWLEFMRTHLSTAVALLLLIPTAISMDLRMSLVLLHARRALCRDRTFGDAQDQGWPGTVSSGTTMRFSRTSPIPSAT